MIVNVLITNPKASHKQLGSALIREIDHSAGSHVAIELCGIVSRNVFEAVWPKTRCVSSEVFYKENEIVKVYQFAIPQDKQYEVHEFLLKQVGKKYSIPQLLLILLDYVIPSNFKPINGDSKLICSELAANFLTKFFGSNFSEVSDTIGVRDIEKECERLELKGGL